MTDILALVAKLRYEECDSQCVQPCHIHRKHREVAADLIEQQAAEIERLRGLVDYAKEVILRQQARNDKEKESDL